MFLSLITIFFEILAILVLYGNPRSRKFLLTSYRKSNECAKLAQNWSAEICMILRDPEKILNCWYNFCFPTFDVQSGWLYGNLHLDNSSSHRIISDESHERFFFLLNPREHETSILNCQYCHHDWSTESDDQSALQCDVTAESQRFWIRFELNVSHYRGGCLHASKSMNAFPGYIETSVWSGMILLNQE